MPSPSPLMLSISGVRGVIGGSLTPDVASRYAAAFGSWLKMKLAGDTAPHVVIGRDSRPSGEMIESAAVAGLLAVGCRVTRIGIATTPGVAIMVDELGGDGGMVVTASHNPIIWNGLKALRSDGVAPPADEANEIIRRFRESDIDWTDVHAMQEIERSEELPRIHRDRILRHLDVAAIREAKLKIVLDSVCGAGGEETRALLDELGVELVHLHGEPTGQFPHEPEPTAENLVSLSDEVPRHAAAIGFAQDPDADRLAVVDERGRYIGEEYTLALCAKHVLSGGQKAVANLSTSRMLDDIAGAVGAEVVRTPVGEANVAAAMKADGAAIGGEGNGGVIWPEVGLVRDSLVGIAILLEMLAKRKQPLSVIAGEIPAYAIVKEKVPASEALIAQLGPKMTEAFADQRIDTQDGVRVDWADRWVHVRPSNTEPIVRLIAEARDAEQAKAIIAEVRGALGLTG
ncbi:MAG: phosphoglucosamine mutase [Phycisphaeraceae bacterium]